MLWLCSLVVLNLLFRCCQVCWQFMVWIVGRLVCRLLWVLSVCILLRKLVVSMVLKCLVMCVCSGVWLVGSRVSLSICYGNGLCDWLFCSLEIGWLVSVIIFSVCWMCWVLLGLMWVVVIGFCLVSWVCSLGQLIFVVLVLICVCSLVLVFGSVDSFCCRVWKYSLVLLISSGILFCLVIVCIVLSVLVWKLVVEQGLVGLWMLISVCGQCVSVVVLGLVLLMFSLWQISVEFMFIRFIGKWLVSVQVSVVLFEVVGFIRKIVSGWVLIVIGKVQRDIWMFWLLMLCC